MYLQISDNIYIYIYIERERDGEIERARLRELDIYICIYIYVYIYICIYIYIYIYIYISYIYHAIEGEFIWNITASEESRIFFVDQVALCFALRNCILYNATIDRTSDVHMPSLRLLVCVSLDAHTLVEMSWYRILTRCTDKYHAMSSWVVSTPRRRRRRRWCCWRKHGLKLQLCSLLNYQSADAHQGANSCQETPLRSSVIECRALKLHFDTTKNRLTFLLDHCFRCL